MRKLSYILENKTSKKEDKKVSKKESKKPVHKSSTKKTSKKELSSFKDNADVLDYWYVPCDLLPMYNSPEYKNNYDIISGICKKLGKEKSQEFFTQIRKSITAATAVKDIPAAEMYMKEIVANLIDDFKDYKINNDEINVLITTIQDKSKKHDEHNTMESYTIEDDYGYKKTGTLMEFNEKYDMNCQTIYELINEVNTYYKHNSILKSIHLK